MRRNEIDWLSIFMATDIIFAIIVSNIGQLFFYYSESFRNILSLIFVIPLIIIFILKFFKSNNRIAQEPFKE